ncbi:MAG: translocation protein TolB, partial [Terriglobia bacterium]
MEANPLAETFNRVLWEDLEYSGIVELVSKSFYPLTQPASPRGLRPDEWAAPPVEAHMVAFGHLSADSQNTSVAAWVHDVRNPRAPAVLAKRYRGEPTETRMRQLAHELADDIVIRLSGGLPGIAQSRIAFASERTGGKEIWLMDYDGHNQTRLTYHNSICLAPR